MGYPRKLLNEGEDIVLDLHPHWRVFLAPGALLVVALGALIVVAQVLDNAPGVIAAAAVFGVALLWLLGRWVVWQTTHFVLTTDRVIHRSGVFSKRGQNIPLERINNVAFNQSVWERLLQVGDLTIESAGETGRQTFSDVLKPSMVENRIYAEIERAAERDQLRGARAGMSVADELGKLEQLRRRGVISEAEFAAQKTRLLGS